MTPGAEVRAASALRVVSVTSTLVPRGLTAAGGDQRVSPNAHCRSQVQNCAGRYCAHERLPVCGFMLGSCSFRVHHTLLRCQPNTEKKPDQILTKLRSTRLPITRPTPTASSSNCNVFSPISILSFIGADPRAVPRTVSAADVRSVPADSDGAADHDSPNLLFVPRGGRAQRKWRLPLRSP